MKPVLLMILDGWGIAEEQGNAIKAAPAVNFAKLWDKYPHSTLEASGEAVGLPEGQQGNSEVGHLNLGAGRVVYQELTKINKAVREHTIEKNPAFNKVMDYCLANDKALHFMGLTSPGGVHSHVNHLLALVKMAKAKGLEKIYIHCFLDGRDVPPESALEYITELEQELTAIGAGKIATLSGRYYAMDRDNRWERVERAYNNLTGHGDKFAVSALSAIKDSYAAKITDEFLEPVAITGADGAIKSGDGVIFYNYRADRAREISRAFCEKNFAGFARKEYLNVHFVGMTMYADGFDEMMDIAFPLEDLKDTLGEVIAKAGLPQLRIAETEKYAHVTSFFNGSIVEPNPLEERILVPSPKVATYDLKPEMSAYEVTDKVLAAIDKDKYAFILLNFANPDMVGHTGVFEAAVKAVQTVDECLQKVIDKILAKNGAVLLCADHGNVEKMYDADGGPFTAHTANLVPFIAIGTKAKAVRCGSLQDVAPTVLDLLEIAKPALMTGQSLLEY